MDSAGVISVAGSTEQRSVHYPAVPPKQASTVVAVLSTASIFGVRLRYSSSVVSDVQHSPAALVSPLAGVDGGVQVEANGVARILVVVCKSFCA